MTSRCGEVFEIIEWDHKVHELLILYGCCAVWSAKWQSVSARHSASQAYFDAGASFLGYCPYILIKSKPYTTRVYEIS